MLASHQALDEKRLSFAKRAEALNRWLEEATDTMSEVRAPSHLPHLPTCLPTCPPAHLPPTCPPACPPATYLPAYLPTYLA